MIKTLIIAIPLWVIAFILGKIYNVLAENFPKKE